MMMREPYIDDYESDVDYLIALECHLIAREVENEAIRCKLEQEDED